MSEVNILASPAAPDARYASPCGESPGDAPPGITLECEEERWWSADNQMRGFQEQKRLRLSFAPVLVSINIHR